ncbi:unnamed protein product [Heterobilharzia americana]|nr:unnamed protein product [Heterobilharzia americana]
MKRVYLYLLVVICYGVTAQYSGYNQPRGYRNRPNNGYKPNGFGRNNNNDKYYNNNNYNNKNHNPSGHNGNRMPKLTKRYTIEGQSEHVFNKHGENYLKAFGSMFGFSDTHQGSDYAQTTTFHSGGIYGRNGKKKYFSTYDTEGEVKHYQDTKGQVKLKVNGYLNGHETVDDKRNVKATATYETDGNSSGDDDASYSPMDHPY